MRRPQGAIRMMASSGCACMASEKASRSALRVRDALCRLSDRHRAVIYRSYYLGRTTAQIAAELQTDDDVIKRELHHALHAVRLSLAIGVE